MLHTWFTRSVGRDPGAVALVVGGQEYSYAELDVVSRGIAGRLRAEGIERPRVGLLASRTTAAYAGYLATLRVGGVVVPLNDAYPSARLEAVARAAQLDLVLADREQDTVFAAGLGVPVVRLGPESIRELLRSPAADTDPDSDADPVGDLGDPDDLAYLLFTSGSTGRPKGVPIRHRNLDAFLAHVIDRYAIGPGSRLSQTFHLTFDLSVFDLFAAWGGGATLVVPSPEDLFDPVDFVKRAGLTHWFSVPSVVSLARGAGLLAPGSMPGLRWSLFCGEQLTLEQARAWAAAAPESVVENLYGPTEVTIALSSYRLAPDPSTWPTTTNGTVPIGEVYAHLEHRLDPDSGELQVRGPQMFDGYLDPADDVDRFAADASGSSGTSGPSDVSGSSGVSGPSGLSGPWYRTGDRVALTDHGLLHLGRLDHQVKILGHRVELPEIEALLRACPGVHDAVVAVVSDTATGSASLAALCTGTPSSPRVLREALRAGLPLAVVPKRYVFVEQLPLNDRGKVDRAACAVVLAAGG